jgi:serine phosphatase RsbU (regulator of sigma subunit)
MTQESFDPLKVMHRLSCAIAGAPDLPRVYQILLDEVVDMLGVEKASIMIYDHESEGLRIAAARGMEPDLMSRAFVKVGQGISGRVFESDEPILVEDIKATGKSGAGRDRYKTSSLMSAPVTCFPMRVGTQPLGVINVTDKSDGSKFTPEDLQLLTTAANQVAAYVHICHLADEVRASERMRNELDVARSIQQRLLPAKPLELDTLDVVGRVVPAEKVGGDYYDYFMTHTRRPSLVVADVSGHNITAALVMAALRSVIRAQRDADYPPSALIQKVNTILFDDLSNTEQFISMVYVQYMQSRQMIRYTNAGHPPPLVWRSGLKNFEELSTDDPLMGIDPLSVYHEKNMVVSRGDVIVLYTDGVVETANEKGERFGMEAFRRLVKEKVDESSTDIVDGIIDEVFAHAGGEKIKDDITVLVCKVL